MSFANQIIDRCRSTNDLAKSLAEKGDPHGTWVSARTQDAGRGRLARKWASLEGNLFLSYVARIEPRDLWSWIPLTTSVAIVGYLAERFPHGEFRIKWPNDILATQQGVAAKLGGILCEGTSSSRPYVVVGVGLNCLQSPVSEEMGQPVTDLTSCAKAGIITADDIRTGLLENLDLAFGRLMTEGKSWIASAYDQRSFYEEGAELTWGTPPATGRVVGLGESAELLVKSSTGEVRRLFSDEVRVRTRAVSGASSQRRSGDDEFPL